jgi:TP901 family phage tail tape measure protein
LVAEKAQALNLTKQEYVGILGNINNLVEQERAVLVQLDQLKAKELEQTTAIHQKEAERAATLSKIAVDLGLSANATQEEIIAKRDSLVAEQATGRQKEKNRKLIEATNRGLEEVKSKNLSIGQLTRRLGENLDKQKNKIAEQASLFDQLRVIFDKLNLSAKERDEIEARLTPTLMNQTAEAEKVRRKTEQTAKAARDNERAQRGVNSALKEMPANFAEKAGQAFIYYQAINAIRRVARAAVQTLVELDRTLTDIAIVTNLNREQTQALIPRYQEMAKEVGLTTTAVVDLSTAFFRQGREAEDALQLTVTAAKFARIAAINVNDAANFLTAAINGFNLSATDSTRIIDRFAALGAGAAASAQEIAIALSKVAPAAASAGVEVDNLMAFITKGIETTREAPENIGTAFKTIFARMRQLTDIGKTVEDGMDVNRVDNALKNIGVSLRDANGEFRDLDDVLIEVGQQWPNITRNQQAYVATTLAGTRQQTRLIALFEDFDRTLELIEVSQQSAGAAAIQHAEFMEGLEAATTNLKTSFQEFITSIANSDQMLAVINALRMAIDLLNTVFGKLILTGLAFKALTVSLTTGQGRFSKMLQSVARGIIGLTKPMQLLNMEQLKNNALLVKNSVITKTKTLTALIAKTKQLGMAKMMQIGYGKAVNLTALKLTGFRFSMIKTIALQKKQSVAQVMVGLTAKKMGTSFVLAGKKMLLMMAKLLVSPLALIVAIGGIVIALKKISEATDTTNPTIAEFQIRIKKAAEALKNIVQRIKDFFTNLINGEGIAAKFFQFFLNGWKKIFAFLGRLPLIGEMFQAFTEDLSDTEQAAANVVVLTNKIKDLNDVIRNTTDASQKLSRALERYRDLSRQRFLSSAELREQAELERELQGRLGTTATGFDLMYEARLVLDSNQDTIDKAAADVSTLIRDAMEATPGVTLTSLIETDLLPDEVKENIPAIVEEYAKLVIEGFEDASPEVQAALLRMIGLDPEKFEKETGQALEAVSDRTVPITFTTTEEVANSGMAVGTTKTEEVTKTINLAIAQGTAFADAYQQAVAAGFQGSENDFAALTAGLFEASIRENSLFTAAADGTVATLVGLQNELRDINTAEGLTDFFTRLNGVVSTLDPSDIDVFTRSFRELSNLNNLNLSPASISGLMEEGGVTFIRDFADVVSSGIDTLGFKDVVIGYEFIETGHGMGGRLEEVIKTAEQQGDEFTNSLMDHILGQEGPMSETIANLYKNGFEGFSGEQLRGMRLEDLLGQNNLESLGLRVNDDVEAIQKLREVASKSIGELSQDEIDFLSTKYPEVLQDMQDGSLDLEAVISDIRATRMEDLENEKEVADRNFSFQRDDMLNLLGLQGEERNLTNEQLLAKAKLALAEGRISQEAFNRLKTSIEDYDVTVAVIDAQAERLQFEQVLTDQIKARYQAQIDIIKAQKDAIKDAKTIRDLQKETADIAVKSIEATRIGAVGTLEAQFNRQSLNAEISEMNRTLQDRLMTAQLDAQQKIIEESQQQALTAATTRLAQAIEPIVGPIEDIARNLNNPVIPSTSPTTLRNSNVNIGADGLDQTIRLAE